MRMGQLTPALISRLGATLYPFGWLRSNAQPSAQPGTVPQSDTLMHYTLVNVFAQVLLDGVSWYQMGLHQWATSSRPYLGNSSAGMSRRKRLSWSRGESSGSVTPQSRLMVGSFQATPFSSPPPW